MMRICIAVIIWGLFPAFADAGSLTCAPLGMNKAELMKFRDGGFEMAPSQRDELAQGLVACLGHPDPDLRDKVAYEGLAHLLREGELEVETIRKLMERLLVSLDGGVIDPEGFERPFAALALAEIARVDRIKPIYTSEELDRLVQAASLYLRSVTDYRGFDEVEGWRHGVAHGADLLMQLSLNTRLDAVQRQTILDAVASQVSPIDHFYIYGEPGRLARPVIYGMMGDGMDLEAWEEWLARIIQPSPFENWDDVFTTQAGLAKLHNTRAFLEALYTNVSVSGNPNLAVLRPSLSQALVELP